MTDEPNLWNTARESLDAAESADAPEALPLLRTARDAVDTLLNDALAKSVLSGSSLRSAALASGYTDNAVAGRLANTALGSYAEGGRVSARSVERARYDLETKGSLVEAKPEPMKFVARKSRANG